MSEKKSHQAIGIDLGTTFSVVAHLNSENRPETIRNAEGDPTTPSVIYYDRNGPVVGKEAVKVAPYEPELVSQWAKREMGNTTCKQEIRGQKLPPEVPQALVLEKLKRDAELVVGPIRHAVVTVPAYYNEPRRKATQDAGALAGLNVLDIINEPTAAAIAFGVQQGFLSPEGESQRRETVLVYDLGGGTFDVTLMEIDGRSYRAIATAGDVYLGGIDWDRRIADHVAAQFRKEFGIDPRNDSGAKQRLLNEVEDAKRTLSGRDSTTIRYEHSGHRCNVSVTREEFESLTGDLLERTIFTTQSVLREASMKWDKVSRLLLVGGSSRMPMIQQALEEQSGMQVDRSLSPDEAIAHGAAVYAGLLISKATTLRPSFEVKNVNSHDLSVLGTEPETGMKRRAVLIRRNTPLPAKGAKGFVTRVANQTSVAVNVIEGGDASGSNATRIGKCVVADLPHGLPKGTPIHVFFHYTSCGRLEVSAKLPKADRKATTLIERSSGMSNSIRDEWERRMREGLFDDEEEEPHATNAGDTDDTWAPGAFSIDQEADVEEVPADSEDVILMDDDDETIIEELDEDEDEGDSGSELDDFFRSQNW